jgi:hypothetical protein
MQLFFSVNSGKPIAAGGGRKRQNLQRGRWLVALRGLLQEAQMVG